MIYYYCVVMLLLVFLLCTGILESNSVPLPAPAKSMNIGIGKTFLDWSDMEVELSLHPLPAASGRRNGNRIIIIVDKNGSGDSVTVQGAVNMVPILNRIRHKIYIRPGIYR